jgi:hypothetical protein
MKAKITKVEYIKEYDTQFGKLHQFRIEYDGKVAYYSSKNKDQKKFEPNKECEFNEEKRTGKTREELIDNL